MTQQQKRGITWSAAAIIAAAGLVWGGASRIQSIEDCANLSHAKSTEALEIAVENRTRATLLEDRVDQLESRVGDLEDIKDIVVAIYEEVRQ